MIIPKLKIGLIVTRLISIYLFMHALDVVSSLGLFLAYRNAEIATTGSHTVAVAFYLVWALLYFTASIFVYLKADAISKFVFRDVESESVETSDSNAGNIETIVYSVVGLCILATAIPHLARTVYVLFYSDRYTQQTTLDIITTTMSLLVGAVLTFSAQGLQSLIQKVRHI